MGMDIDVKLPCTCGKIINADVFGGDGEGFDASKDHLEFYLKLYPEYKGMTVEELENEDIYFDEYDIFVRCPKCKKIVFYYRISY